MLLLLLSDLMRMLLLLWLTLFFVAFLKVVKIYDSFLLTVKYISLFYRATSVPTTSDSFFLMPMDDSFFLSISTAQEKAQAFSRSISFYETMNASCFDIAQWEKFEQIGNSRSTTWLTILNCCGHACNKLTERPDSPLIEPYYCIDFQAV